MKLPWLGSKNIGQKGFTLIELAIAMAIGSMIAGAVTMTIFQIVNSSSRTSNHMTVVRQVQSAGYWVSNDARMAQVITPAASPDPDGFPLVLEWTSWDGTVNVVTYELQDTDLVRCYNGQQDVVSQFIDSIEVGPRPFTGGKLTLIVTVKVGAGSAAQTETRIYEVTPRPG
jgi:prepilin-type N-terminal cleavage/methylation domain-containing protein